MSCHLHQQSYKVVHKCMVFRILSLSHTVKAHANMRSFPHKSRADLKRRVAGPLKANEGWDCKDIIHKRTHIHIILSSESTRKHAFPSTQVTRRPQRKGGGPTEGQWGMGRARKAVVLLASLVSKAAATAALQT